MTSELADQDATFGYLSTWDSPEHGCLGGYLIVSQLGRPLEFHCTAPLRPSRAQQILFGPTLWPYVLGEQIGGVLVDKAELRPFVVLVDHPATLCLRSRIGVPMVRLTGEKSIAPGTACAEQTSTALTPHLIEESDFVIELAPGFDADREVVGKLLSLLAQHVDLAEPFDRIHEAIREAQRLGDLGQQDAHEQAA